MHIVLVFNSQLYDKGLSDIQVVKTIRENGLSASPLSTYYIEQPDKQGLILGFANTELHQIDPHIKTLQKIFAACSVSQTSKN